MTLRSARLGPPLRVRRIGLVVAGVLAVLGVLATGVATWVYFVVVTECGPAFLSTINYLIPVVAFFLGAWLLSEPVSWHHFAALATILGGIAITRIRATPVPGPGVR